MEIQGYSNYIVYDDGRIFSKKRNKFIKPRLHSGGYHQVSLCKDGKYKNHYIHRLVGVHYIDNPDNKPQIDHINRIRTDNRVCNLRWTTRSENCCNKGLKQNNKTGHICIYKNHKRWRFQKTIPNKKITKYFNSLTDALCYKFIIMLKIKALN
jgi:hypothetical protein